MDKIKQPWHMYFVELRNKIPNGSILERYPSKTGIISDALIFSNIGCIVLVLDLFEIGFIKKICFAFTIQGKGIYQLLKFTADSVNFFRRVVLVNTL